MIPISKRRISTDMYDNLFHKQFMYLENMCLRSDNISCNYTKFSQE